MTKESITEEYFNWMYKKVMGKNNNYRNLLNCLNSVEFKYTIDRDSSRYGDGISLRYLFGLDKHYPDTLISSMLDDHPCSVLEMMVALSNRCETSIMDDPFIGDRTGVWFFDMIISLGLEDMNDDHFNFDQVRKSINRMLSHNYAKNGRGGLFTIRDSTKDMRNEEIWCQMMWYLNDIIDKT